MELREDKKVRGRAMLNTFTDDNLSPLGVDELIRLSERIEKLISAKLREEKRSLQQKLSTIEQYERGAHREQEPLASPGKRRKMRRSKALPKYRDPKTGATWSGRGMLPRWLAAEIANGSAREDFRISAAPILLNGDAV